MGPRKYHIARPKTEEKVIDLKVFRSESWYTSSFSLSREDLRVVLVVIKFVEGGVVRYCDVFVGGRRCVMVEKRRCVVRGCRYCFWTKVERNCRVAWVWCRCVPDCNAVTTLK